MKEEINKMFVGRYCIVRCDDAGVHAGIVVAIEGRSIVLKESKRLWYWYVKKNSYLSSIAIHGLGNGCKISEEMENPILLTEDCEIIICTKEAEKSIREYEIYQDNGNE